MPTLTSVNAQWTNAIAVSDADLRRVNAGGLVGNGTTLGARGGIVRHSDTSLAVTVNGSDQITVQAGVVAIPSSVALAGVYMAAFGAVTGPGAGTAIAARNSTNPRIDLVIADINAGQARIRTVDGTPGSSPTAPALPAGSVELARLNVPNTGGGAVTVTNTFRTYAASLGGVLPVETSSQLPGSGNQKGQPAVALDTGIDYRWDGTGWISQVPGVVAVRREIASNQAFSNPTSSTLFSAGADKTAMSTTLTKATASTRLLVSLQASAVNASGIAQRVWLGLRIAGTNYDVAMHTIAAATTRQQFAGTAIVSGVAAGSVAIEPFVRSSTAISLVFYGTDDSLSYSVQEVA